MAPEFTKAVNVNIDINQMREMSALACRRASAFARLGLEGLDDRDGGDFNLTAVLTYQFWPNELKPEQKEATREEFRSWLVGSCIRELDLFHSLILDKVWFALEVLDLHGTKVRSDHVFDQKFSRNTNVANKQRLVSERLAIPDHFEALNSLSLARNALTHHAGHVRSPADCNNDARDQLTVRWLALDIVVSRGGKDRVVEGFPFDVEALGLPGDGDAALGVKPTLRSLEIAAGQKIVFTNEKLAELCMFYKIIAEQTISGLIASMRAKGLVDDAPPDGSAAAK